MNLEIHCQCGAVGSRGEGSMSSMLGSPTVCPGSSATKSNLGPGQPQTQSLQGPLDARGLKTGQKPQSQAS